MKFSIFFILLMSAAAFGIPHRRMNVKLNTIPIWSGQYSIDQACDRTRCCCFDGYMTITETSSAMVRLTAGVVGPYSYCGTSHTLTFRRPVGFDTSITSDGDKFLFSLNGDSSKITIRYEQEDSMQCQSTAIKMNF